MAYRAFWMTPGNALAKDLKETVRRVKRGVLSREMGKSWEPYTPSRNEIHRAAHSRPANYSEIQTKTRTY